MPDKPVITVAVLPFESKSRFDRIRPLELGIRDLVTTRLLGLSGAAVAGAGNRAQEKPRGEPLRFQVLQRSSMEQLLRELDLIRSGLSDKSRMPEELPARAAVYLVRGEIDERQTENNHTIVVRGELRDVAAGKVLETIAFECPPATLADRLGPGVDRIAQRLCKLNQLAAPPKPAETFEVASLKELAIGDVARFKRVIASSGWQDTFRLPNRALDTRWIEIDSAQGR